MRKSLLVAIFLVLSMSAAKAGPPFLTDDPAPIDYKHCEFYVFSTWDKGSATTSTIGPAIEYNCGPAPNVHLHIVVPYQWNSMAGGPSTSGLGDIELGVKFRFVQETAGRPQIGIFPMAELATGNATQNLGNGRTWYKLPLWIQKSYGPWTTYGGGGYALNAAPGAQNYPFAGWLVQRDLSRALTLGGEIFTQGPSAIGGRHATFYTVGGYLKPTDSFNVLFDVGHTISGESHAVGYVGLYWTWGPAEKPEPPKPEASSKP
jgi:hypothetical protein